MIVEIIQIVCTHSMHHTPHTHTHTHKAKFIGVFSKVVSNSQLYQKTGSHFTLFTVFSNVIPSNFENPNNICMQNRKNSPKHTKYSSFLILNFSKGGNDVNCPDGTCASSLDQCPEPNGCGECDDRQSAQGGRYAVDFAGDWCPIRCFSGHCAETVSHRTFSGQRSDKIGFRVS